MILLLILIDIKIALLNLFGIGAVDRDVEENMALPVVPSYGALNSKMRLMERQQYVSLNDFVRFLRDAAYTSFFVHANRERIRSDYFAILGPCPFPQNRRFPEDFFVSVSSGKIRVWLNQMMQAMDMPDRHIERDNAGVFGNLNDAKRAFAVAVNNLLGLAECVDDAILADSGIYSRETFERTFNLTWV